MKRLIFPLLLSFIIFGCQESKDLDAKLSAISFSDSLEIKVPTTVNAEKILKRFTLHANCLTSFGSPYSDPRNIVSYSFTDKNWEQWRVPKKYFLDQINFLSAKDDGGFFVFPYSTGRFYSLYPTNDKSGSSYFFSDPDVLLNQVLLLNNIFLGYDEDHVFFPSLAFDYKNDPDNYLSAPHLIAKYDLSTRQEQLMVSFPESYHDWGSAEQFSYADLDYSYILLGDSLIVNFNLASAIYVYDKKSGVFIGKKDVSFPYLNNLEPLPERAVDDPQMVSLFREINGEYGGLIYDPYRKFVIRIAKIFPEKNERRITKSKEAFSLLRKRKICLAFLDTSLNLLGMAIMPDRGETLLPLQDGLYVASPHHSKESTIKLLQLDLSFLSHVD